MFSSAWTLGYILLTLATPALALYTTGYDNQEVVCSENLSRCSVRDEMPIPSLSPTENEAAHVTGMKVQANMACCNKEEGAQCALCLSIGIQLNINLNEGTAAEGRSSGLHGEEDDHKGIRSKRAFVTVCYTAAPSLPVCKKVQFTVTPTTPTKEAQVTLVITKPSGVLFSSSVSVFVLSTKLKQDLVMPSIDEVCAQASQERIEECDVPRLNSTINQERNQVELHVDDKNKGLPTVVCLQYERNGKCQLWNRTSIPLYLVTSCMCLQVWWDERDQRSRRSVSCPFTKHEASQKTVWNNVSMSVVQGQMTYNDAAMLSWNLSAPCRLEGEVWPCQQTAHNKCKEMQGFRWPLSNGTWRQNSKGQWEIPGVFEDINIQLSPCVMAKCKGLDNYLGPFCINDNTRGRWNLLVIASVLLLCLAALMFCLLHHKLKRWAQSWRYGNCLQTTVRGHVVLLSPPEGGSAVSESVCGLGSLLRDQGFSVSVDQWSRVEQCSLGPLPWLHSQLLHLDSVGRGRVVLVLTQKARDRTEEWSRQHHHHQDAAAYGNREEDKGPSPQASSPYSDLFTAALCCVGADKKAGRAGERFMLVNFEAFTTSQPPCGDRGLPELLQGLTLFHLPSQTQALLSELSAGRRMMKQCDKIRKTGGVYETDWKKVDQLRMPHHKCLGTEKNWEMKPLT